MVALVFESPVVFIWRITYIKHPSKKHTIIEQKTTPEFIFSVSKKIKGFLLFFYAQNWHEFLSSWGEKYDKNIGHNNSEYFHEYFSRGFED